MKVAKKLARLLLNTSEPGRELVKAYGLTPYLSAAGWFLSIDKGMPVDNQGNPLPWYTYPFIRFLEPRARATMKVFEYGSGNSTLWWSARAANVVACEHDESWFEDMSKRLPPNVDYRFSKLEYGGEYCRAVAGFVSEFDCIVIDGRDRVNCAKNALGALKEDGVIIWDNSDRERYREGYDFLIENGFRRIDFWGLGPINAYEWCTSVFYRKENCFEI